MIVLFFRLLLINLFLTSSLIISMEPEERNEIVKKLKNTIDYEVIIENNNLNCARSHYLLRGAYRLLTDKYAFFSLDDMGPTLIHSLYDHQDNVWDIRLKGLADQGRLDFLRQKIVETSDINTFYGSYENRCSVSHHYHYNALMVATACGSPDISKRLLERAIVVNQANQEGRTALFDALCGCCISLLSLHEVCPEKIPAEYVEKTLYDYIKTVALLLHYKAKQEAAGSEKVTPLMIAALIGCPSLVGLLLYNGADAETKDAANLDLKIYLGSFYQSSIKERLIQLQRKLVRAAGAPAEENDFAQWEKIKEMLANYTDFKKVIADRNAPTLLHLLPSDLHTEMIRFIFPVPHFKS